MEINYHFIGRVFIGAEKHARDNCLEMFGQPLFCVLVFYVVDGEIGNVGHVD